VYLDKRFERDTKKEITQKIPRKFHPPLPTAVGRGGWFLNFIFRDLREILKNSISEYFLLRFVAFIWRRV
jgi:hypothetical protein